MGLSVNVQKIFDARYQDVSDNVPIDGTQANIGVDVTSFGATGNGATDDTAAIQRAINAIHPQGGTLYFPAGTYTINSGPLTGIPSASKLIGDGRGATWLQSTAGTSDMFAFNDHTQFLTMEGFRVTMWSGGGHIFAPQGVFTQGFFHDLRLAQNNPHKSIWKQPNAGYYYNNWRDFYFYHDGATTVPAMDFTSATGSFHNANLWHGGTIENSTQAGTWFFDFATSAAGDFIYGNTFRDITCEVNNGGIARIRTASGFVFDNIEIYDLTLTANHLFWVGAGGGGLASRQTVFRKVRRIPSNSAIGAGLVDIYLDVAKAQNTFFEMCHRSNSSPGFTVELNNASFAVAVHCRNTTFNNAPSTFTYLGDNNVAVGQIVDPATNAPMIGLLPQAAGVNYVEVKNAATGHAPHIRSAGTDTDVGLQIFTQNAGGLQVVPGADSTTSVQIQDSSNSPIVNVDSVNGRVGINTAIPSYNLSVIGTGNVSGTMGMGSAAVGGLFIQTGIAAPISGTYQKGDQVWNTNPVGGGNMGWVCVTSGTPGTWKTFGTISA